MVDETTTSPRRLGVAIFSQGILVAEWIEDRGLVWTLDGYARSQVAFMRQKEWYANYISNEPFESYSVAHGEMGYHMAASVAEKIGAEWRPNLAEDEDDAGTTDETETVVY